MPLFSVMIAAYNRADLIGKTIDSVLAQTFTDYEFIVVDDGSTDRTASVVESYGDKVTLIRQENKGEAGARNACLQHATGEYLAFIDSDDLWFPWTLDTYARIIEKYDCPALIAASIFSFSNEQELKKIQDAPLDCLTAEDYLTGANRYHSHMGLAASLMRRDVAKQIGPLVEKKINVTDTDFMLRASTFKGFVLVRKPILLGYRQHAGSIMGNPDMAYAGVQLLRKQERSGAYPGGRARRSERLRCITVRVRAVSVGLLRRGRPALAWRLYWQALFWHLRLKRFRYLVVFPLMAMFPPLRKMETRRK